MAQVIPLDRGKPSAVAKPGRSRLTAPMVRTAASGRYSDGNGLYLDVTAPHAASWVVRYTVPKGLPQASKRRDIGIGPARGNRAISLADARAMAIGIHSKLLQGIDPLAERQAVKDAEERAAQPVLSFATVAERYIVAHEAGWKNAKHRQQWRNTLAQYVYPVIGNLAIDVIGTEAVLAVLQRIWLVTPETASRVRMRVEAVLSYAKAQGWRGGENPAVWRGHLELILPAKGKVHRVEHHAALDWRAAPAFMRQLRQQTSVGAMALEFAILTAARSGEVRLAAMPEIDRERNLWTIPAGRMKAGREHRVPLSQAARDLLAGLDGFRQPGGPLPAEGFLFPGQRRNRPLSDMALTSVLRRMGHGEITAHGFRSTFRDWASGTTHYPGEMLEVALAHAVGSKTEAAYRRGDMLERRRQLMADWADYLAATIETLANPLSEDC
jgi:integrase